MWWSKNSRKPDALLLPIALAMAACIAAPALAQKTGPNAPIVNQRVPEARPDIEAECTAYAQQTAAEEYLARDSTLRQTSPFQSGPAGTRDPYVASQRQDLAIQRTAREKELYDACVARLMRERQ
ncbi:MAG: hypothetical protein AB7F36_16615 [Reyranellaceae bacterium]